MAKIAVIGAGSLVFTRKLVSDLLQQEATADAEITLMDIDTERLREVGEVVDAMVARGGGTARVRLTNDWADGVRGAGYVMNTIADGRRRAVTSSILTSLSATGSARRSPIRMGSEASPGRSGPSRRSWPWHT